jgi:hypothetical protein
MRSVSHADAQLIRDTGASPTQLERWRRYGVLQPATRRYLGRRGSTSAYPPEAVAQVSELLAITGRGKAALSDTALTMFGRGGRRYVRDDTLRRVLHGSLDELEKLVGQLSNDTLRDAEDAVTRAQQRQADGVPASWRSRLSADETADESPDDRLYSASVCAIYVILTGQPSYETALSDLLDASGVSELAMNRSGLTREEALAPVLTLLARFLDGLSFASLRASLDELDVHELEGARDQVRILAEKFKPIATLPDKSIAYIALALASARRRFFPSELRSLDKELSKPEDTPPETG